MTGPNASAAQAAADCLRLYAEDPRYDPYWDRVYPHDGGYAALVRGVEADGTPIQRVVWRGSTTALDWWRNFEALPVIAPGLGHVHAGFWRGVCAAKSEIIKDLDLKDIVVSGHSRGAAEAALFAAYLAIGGWRVRRLVLFGCPRPGYQQVPDVLAAHKVEIQSYKNLTDPVTDVPFSLDLIGTACDLPYVPVAPFISLAEHPVVGDPWERVAPHRMCLYARAFGV